ncbi:putative RNA binding protein [Aspergillus affinis]|uniref:putative RNA binding protein n=1 Tax=Aspergillus affinis TaxID=1070780 RepID=UPI0022FE5B7E|nr:RNA-binding domain-containing protein [Aspergillus affinis]KAI9036478.1 RNA-binding domain-containing protein [Aspergillus affinis]
MDRSLDEIIAERPQQNQNRGRRPQGQGRRRDGVKKVNSLPSDAVFNDRDAGNPDWVHDKYEDDRDARPSRAPRRPRGDRYSPQPEHAHTGSKLRIENLHYDITESDLEDLFSRIGPVTNLTIVYDRAGRSEGVAYVTYSRNSDARTAINEFDGANAKGQPIRLSLVAGGGGGSSRRDRNPFDNIQRPKGSLFDRVERPRGGRDARSLSPGSASDDPDGARRRRGGGRRGGAGRYRRSDVSKPAPEHIDRYVPGQRSPTRRPANGGGRRQGGGGGGGGENRRTANGRPRKTQEELDQEMDDYWGGATGGSGAAEKQAGAEEHHAPAAAAPVAAPAAGGDDDVDMIE